ncbi:MAG: DUF5667 domain-containing protein [Patescibacteria group bacterium]|nr:DUF5667 domain-containing protein [Patescibacteria group bacterium]
MIKISQLGVIFSTVGLMIGLLIIAVSLMSANRIVSYSGTRVSCRKFYLSQEILPDHLFYPIIAGFDRVILWLAGNEEKIYLRTDYGQIRYKYAQGLLEKNKKDLALTTLTKSQKYFNIAAHEAINLSDSIELKKYVSSSLKENIKLTQEMVFEFTDDKRIIIDDLNNQNQLLVETLSEQL